MINSISISLLFLFAVFCVSLRGNDTVADLEQKRFSIDAITTFSKSKRSLATGTDRGGEVEILGEGGQISKLNVTVGLSNKNTRWTFFVENGKPICVRAWDEVFAWDGKLNAVNPDRFSVRNESWIYFSNYEIAGFKGVDRDSADSNSATALALFAALAKSIQSDAAEIDIEAFLKNGG